MLVKICEMSLLILSDFKNEDKNVIIFLRVEKICYSKEKFIGNRKKIYHF